MISIARCMRFGQKTKARRGIEPGKNENHTQQWSMERVKIVTYWRGEIFDLQGGQCLAFEISRIFLGRWF